MADRRAREAYPATGSTALHVAINGGPCTSLPQMPSSLRNSVLSRPPGLPQRSEPHMARKKIKLKVGDVFEIPLGDDHLAFGHILPWNLVGFYAVRGDRRLPLEDIVRQNVAFRAVCMTDAVEDGRWPLLGNVPPPAAMNEP